MWEYATHPSELMVYSIVIYPDDCPCNIILHSGHHVIKKILRNWKKFRNEQHIKDQGTGGNDL